MKKLLAFGLIAFASTMSYAKEVTCPQAANIKTTGIHISAQTKTASNIYVTALDTYGTPTQWTFTLQLPMSTDDEIKANINKALDSLVYDDKFIDPETSSYVYCIYHSMYGSGVAIGDNK